MLRLETPTNIVSCIAAIGQRIEFVVTFAMIKKEDKDSYDLIFSYDSSVRILIQIPGGDGRGAYVLQVHIFSNNIMCLSIIQCIGLQTEELIRLQGFKVMAERMVSRFWGPVTSTVELCEENYAHSSYIAEFYNTISNIPCIILALVGLINALRQRFEKRFSILHISNMILAIGNIVFHATLQHVVQQSDETLKIWEMLLYLYVLYSPDWHYRSTMPIFLFLYAVCFAATHSLLRLDALFKAQYVLLCLLCVPRMYKYYVHTKDSGAKRIAKLYATTIILGGPCWLADHLFCKKLSGWYINPQGHAWRHVLMGFNSYLTNTFLMFCHVEQLGRSPRIAHLFGLFPYVRIEKSRTQ